jgi:hypothetical protein
VNGQPTKASLWRIEFARELIRHYVPHEGIRMAVLGGSPSKGLADEYSDLDIIVYWDEIDVEWLEGDPLADVECERRYFRKMGDADVYLESQYFGALKADFGHLTMAVWEEMVAGVLERFEVDQSTLGSHAGFLTSIPLYGDPLVDEWKDRVSHYPDELASRIVKQHRRFFVPGYLANQAYKRGDVIAYYDGLCLMLKNLITILAGLNRIYMSVEEPRWIAYYLDRMTIKPDKAWERMKSVLTAEGCGGVEILEGLTSDVLALVEEHMPEFKDGYPDRRLSMAVGPQSERPEIRPKG